MRRVCVGAALVVVLVLGLAVTGCADDGDGDGEALEAGASGGADGVGDLDALDEMVRRLPEDARDVAVIDVAAVRRDLGLPEDQDLDEIDDATAPLHSAVGTAIPFFAMPRRQPLREALDTGAMTAAASVPVAFGPSVAVVVVRTTQPFDELATVLEGEGYQREGELLVASGRVVDLGMTVAAPAGDDLVVLAQSSEVAQAVAAGEGDGPPLAEALATVEGPLRRVVGRAEDNESCVESVAAGWTFDPIVGEIVLTLDGEDAADAEALFPNDDSSVGRNLDLDPPEVDGRTVRATYRVEGPVLPLGFLFGDLLPGDLYRCP